jgi:hypothetical protein
MLSRLVPLSVFFLLTPVSLPGVFAATAQTQETRPNIVLIVTDDQGFGLRRCD